MKQRRRAPAFGDLLLRRNGAHPATLDVSTGSIEKPVAVIAAALIVLRADRRDRAGAERR